MSDDDGMSNPLKFDFGRWGWLGNEWLKRNNFILPSWSQVKTAILNEQIVVLKDEIQETLTKKLNY